MLRRSSTACLLWQEVEACSEFWKENCVGYSHSRGSVGSIAKGANCIEKGRTVSAEVPIGYVGMSVLGKL